MSDLIANIDVWQIVKVMLLLGEGLYLVFAFVVVRQVQLMVSTLDGNLTPVVKMVAWLQLLGAVVLFVFSALLL